MRLHWQTGLLLTMFFLFGFAPRQQVITFQDELSGRDGLGQIIASANNLIVSGLPAAGVVRIGERNGNGEWRNRAELVASDVVIGDGFGLAVAASDGIIVASAPLVANGAGAVYIFERDDAENWQETAKLIASDATENANFGLALSASGDRVVIGAPGQGASGAAYVFARQGAGWVEEAKLVPFDVTAQFGAAVAIENDQIIIGAPQDNMGAGAAYVYLRTTDQWQVAAKLISADASDGDLFGAAVTISNSRMLVGAPQVDADVEDAGAAYVFVRARNAWIEETKLTGAAGKFGQAVALADNLALIAAPGANTVQLYELNADGWQVNADFEATFSANQISGAVAISGSTLSIGAPDSVQIYVVPGVTGNLSMNTEHLVAGEALHIELADPDLNQDPEQAENIILQVTTSSGEQETLILTETNDDSGVFTSNIQSLATSTPRAQDNILDVQSGDTIIVTYRDCALKLAAASHFKLKLLSARPPRLRCQPVRRRQPKFQP